MQQQMNLTDIAWVKKARNRSSRRFHVYQTKSRPSGSMMSEVRMRLPRWAFGVPAMFFSWAGCWIHERALCGTLIKPQLLWIHSLACMLHVNENVHYKGRDEKEMRMGVRGQEVKEEAIINLSNHRPVTLFVLSTLWYFKTNNANTTDVLFLIKEMKRPSKKADSIPFWQLTG